MNSEKFDYGEWATVIFFILFFLVFALSFTRPKSTRDWRSFGAFSAFIVALFVEMYGFPLTIYLLSPWLESRFPKIELFSHATGHLWHAIFNLEGAPHSHLLDFVSTILILGGLAILVFAWRILYKAQQTQTIAKTGLYSRVRHPQYTAFILIMMGYLLTWPTVPTLIMFPILVYMYIRLARREEQKALQEHGEEYERYQETTPAFLPRIRPGTKQKLMR